MNQELVMLECLRNTKNKNVIIEYNGNGYFGKTKI